MSHKSCVSCADSFTSQLAGYWKSLVLPVLAPVDRENVVEDYAFEHCRLILSLCFSNVKSPG